MPISVTNANLVVKDKNGNTGMVKTLTAADVTKLSNAISDVAVVVDPTTHVARPATTSATGVVQLADAAAVTAGTAGRVVDAAQLKGAIEGIDLSGFVDKTTAQTVSGVKTFTALPQSAVAPTTNDQLANKAYVDTAVANSASIAVDSTYVEPAVRKGILSSAVDCITAPSSSHTFEARGAVTGQLIMFCGTTIPDGYLLCNGAAVSRSTYADLFSVIGTLYGAGDGSTTFNLPDCRDRVIQGASSTYAVGTYIPAGLPNINGYLGYMVRTAASDWGVGSLHQVGNPATVDHTPGSNKWFHATVAIDADKSSSYYGATNKPQVDGVSAYTLIKV